VLQEAWNPGVTTCWVEDLIDAMGLDGISKSTAQQPLY
jgi:hypothetical protein